MGYQRESRPNHRGLARYIEVGARDHLRRANMRLAGLTTLLCVGAVGGLMTGCSMGDLLGSGELRELEVAPAEVTDSVVSLREGSRARTLEIRPTSGKDASWTARVARGSPWVRLDRSEGTAPGELRVTLDPGDLESGTYSDTIALTVASSSLGPVRVPVTLVVRDPAEMDCEHRALRPGEEVTDSLTVRSCQARSGNGNPARNFTVDPEGADSISIFLNATGFAGRLLLSAPDGNTLAQATACSEASAQTCLLYVRLGPSGPHTLEVSAASAEAKGSFQLHAVAPREPEPASELAQLDPGTGAEVARGATLQGTSVTLQARLVDRDAWDRVRLEVEIREEGQPLTGQPTHTSSLGSQGPRDLRVDALGPERGYRWQARAVDETGRAGPWVPFATGADPHFRVSDSSGGDGDDGGDDGGDGGDDGGGGGDDDPDPWEPLSPTALGQFRSDGTTSIPSGGSTSETTVVLKAVVHHSDPDASVRLEVQAAPVGLLGIAGSTISGESAPTAPGSEVSITLSGLNRGQGYQWRARTVGPDGAVSSWVTFGDGSSADFHVTLL